MGKYHQKQNIHKKKSHKRKFHIGLWSIVALVLVLLFYVYYDLRINSGEKLEAPSTGYSTVTEEDFTEINESEFYIKMPLVWEKTETNPSDLYKLYSYINSEDGYSARKLDVYIGGYPYLFDTNKIQKVLIDGSRVVPLAVSGQCFDEVERAIDNPVRETTEWNWNDVTFPCNPSSITDIVTAGEETIVLSMTGASSGVTREFTIVYTDHTNRIDNSIFSNGLRTFLAK